MGRQRVFSIRWVDMQHYGIYTDVMPYLPCKICKNKFYAKPRHIKIGWGKYCSTKCQYEGQHNGKFFQCGTCNKKVYRTPKAIKNSRSGRFFCNKSCFAIWKNAHLFFGEDHVNWKHGKHAYHNVMKRNNRPPICTDCGIKDKRVLIVHHIDRNRLNNKIDNLKWLCRNCHYIEHKGKTI